LSTRIPDSASWTRLIRAAYWFGTVSLSEWIMLAMMKTATANSGMGISAYRVRCGEIISIAVRAARTKTLARVAYINAGPTYRRICSISLVDRVITSPVEYC